MKPRPEYLAPFSPAGKVLASLAIAGNTAISFIEDLKKEYSPTVVYGVLAAIPVIILLLILLLTRKTRKVKKSPVAVSAKKISTDTKKNQ